MATSGGPPSVPVEVEEHVGPYRLIRRLGQGGMGVVYLAEGPERKEVALKVLRPHVAHDTIARARLQREVTTLQKVNHPGVAGIVDHDLQAERPYLVTRFIPGRPLDEQVDERGPLTPQKWLPLAGCLAESLQAVHAVGVVHRDLKPGNVMMFNGKPVMIDFGIAQAADDQRLTQTGLVIGTPGYLAPELIEGEGVSESADWWGWAATVTFAATGRRPFGKGPFEVVLSRVHKGQADLEGLDPRLKPLLAAALSPDKRNRPTQDEIMAGLNRYAEGREALIPPPDKVTMVVNPPTAVLTQVIPSNGPDPAEVAKLVPPVIPPLSAFAPIRDKLREAATQHKQEVAAQKAELAARRAAAAGAPPASHPATYSPSPYAAQPPAPPLQYGPAPDPYQSRQMQPYPQPRQQSPAYRPDPEPPRPPSSGKRTAVMTGCLVALTGLIAYAPELGSLLAILLMVLARAVDRGNTALMRRRQNRGRKGKSDGLVAVVGSPVQILVAALITIPCLILPLFTGVIIGAVVSGSFAIARDLEWLPLSAIAFGTTAFVALVTAWWGPGGSSLRRGSRITARFLTRPIWLSATVSIALLVAGGFTFYQAAMGRGTVGPIQVPEIPDAPTSERLRELPIIRDLPLVGR